MNDPDEGRQSECRRGLDERTEDRRVGNGRIGRVEDDRTRSFVTNRCTRDDQVARTDMSLTGSAPPALTITRHPQSTSATATRAMAVHPSRAYDEKLSSLVLSTDRGAGRSEMATTSSRNSARRSTCQ
jgi:hypothetical protein